MNGLPVFLFACSAVCSVCTAQPSAPREARSLSSIHIEEGHDIVFEESPSGMFIVTENARIFQKPLLGETFGRSLADMYRMVQPNGKVPDSLVSADDRLAARRSEPVSAPLPDPPLVPGAGRGPKLYNAGEQAWFKQTFCHDSADPLSLLQCVQGWDWITSGWQLGAIFAGETMVGSEGSPASLDLYWWNGHNEVKFSNYTVYPGTYTWYYVPYYQPFWWHVNLSGAGANTQVSQDIRTCGNGGEWACSRNCGGSISCNPQNTTYCSIVGASGESWCNNR
jgi:hypothetical protein